MEPTDRITWVTCPKCGEDAAVGWLGVLPVEFDCRARCRLTISDLARYFRTDGAAVGNVYSG